MTILIVDDNETDRKVLRNILEREGIQTLEAEDGVEALTVLERERVDAVIADVIMPNMDGYQFCYELRRAFPQRRLPVVIYTSHFANEAMGEIAREFGADLYLKKPASPEQIVESIRMARDFESRKTAQGPLKLPEIYRDKKTYSEWLIRKLEEQNTALELSEERYRQLVELSPDGIVVICEGEFVFANGTILELLGATSESDIVGKKVASMIHPDFRDVIGRRMSDLLQGHLDRNPPLEQKLIRVGGGFVDVETMSASFRFFDKSAVLVIVRDISERKKTEAKLMESQRNLVMAQKIANIGSWTLDLADLNDVNRNPLTWSDQVFRIFGFEPGQLEVSSENFFRCIPAEDRPPIEKAVAAALAEGKPYRIEHRVIRPDGEVRIVEEQAEIVYSDGKPIKMVGTVQDITGRKKADQSLHQREEQLRMALVGAGAGMWIWDLVDNWITTPEVNLLFGRPLDAPPMKIEEYNSYFYPDDTARIREAWQNSIRNGDAFDQEYRVIWKDGSMHWLASKGRVISLPPGSKQFFGITMDITERKRADEEVHRIATKYRMLMEQASDAILIADADGHYMDANNRATEIFGYSHEELLQKKIGALTNGSGDDILRKIVRLEPGETYVSERKCCHKDGTAILTELSGRKLPDGKLQIIFRELSRQNRPSESLKT